MYKKKPLLLPHCDIFCSANTLHAIAVLNRENCYIIHMSYVFLLISRKCFRYQVTKKKKTTTRNQLRTDNYGKWDLTVFMLVLFLMRDASFISYERHFASLTNKDKTLLIMYKIIFIE